MKRFHNTIKHHQRQRLGAAAYALCLAEIYLAQAIVTTVLESTPEQRAAVRAAFDEIHPNFFPLRQHHG